MTNLWYSLFISFDCDLSLGIHTWVVRKIFLNFITTKMSFQPADYASAYVTVDEVLEIKKAFDFFDRDLGGAIDPKGTPSPIQNSRSPLTPSVLRPRPRQSTK